METVRDSGRHGAPAIIFSTLSVPRPVTSACTSARTGTYTRPHYAGSCTNAFTAFTASTAYHRPHYRKL